MGICDTNHKVNWLWSCHNEVDGNNFKRLIFYLLKINIGMNYFVKYLLIIVIILTPFITFAHPGHGQVEASQFAHYTTSPEHLLAGGIVLAGFILWYFRKKVKTAKA
jgi:putative copper export protein